MSTKIKLKEEIISYLFPNNERTDEVYDKLMDFNNSALKAINYVVENTQDGMEIDIPLSLEEEIFNKFKEVKKIFKELNITFGAFNGEEAYQLQKNLVNLGYIGNFKHEDSVFYIQNLMEDSVLYKYGISEPRLAVDIIKAYYMHPAISAGAVSIYEINAVLKNEEKQVDIIKTLVEVLNDEDGVVFNNINEKAQAQLAQDLKDKLELGLELNKKFEKINYGNAINYTELNSLFMEEGYSGGAQVKPSKIIEVLRQGLYEAYETDENKFKEIGQSNRYIELLNVLTRDLVYDMVKILNSAECLNTLKLEEDITLTTKEIKELNKQISTHLFKNMVVGNPVLINNINRIFDTFSNKDFIDYMTNNLGEDFTFYLKVKNVSDWCPDFMEDRLEESESVLKEINEMPSNEWKQNIENNIQHLKEMFNNDAKLKGKTYDSFKEELNKYYLTKKKEKEIENLVDEKIRLKKERNMEAYFDNVPF